MRRGPSTIVLNTIGYRASSARIFLRQFVSRGGLCNHFVPVKFEDSVGRIFRRYTVCLTAYPVSNNLVARCTTVGTGPVLRFLAPSVRSGGRARRMVYFGSSFPVSFAYRGSFLLRTGQLVNSISCHGGRNGQLCSTLVGGRRFSSLLVGAVASGGARLPVRPCAVRCSGVAG